MYVLVPTVTSMAFSEMKEASAAGAEDAAVTGRMTVMNLTGAPSVFGWDMLTHGRSVFMPMASEVQDVDVVAVQSPDGAVLLFPLKQNVLNIMLLASGNAVVAVKECPSRA